MCLKSAVISCCRKPKGGGLPRSHVGATVEGILSRVPNKGSCFLVLPIVHSGSSTRRLHSAPPSHPRNPAQSHNVLTSKAERLPSIDRRLCSRRSSSKRLLRCVSRSALATRACAGVDARMSTCSVSLVRGEGRRVRKQASEHKQGLEGKRGKVACARKKGEKASKYWVGKERGKEWRARK